MSVRFSFLCPAYNHERYIGRFLSCLHKQTDPDWELVLVDDCSSDRTAEIVSLYGDSRIKLIRHDVNRGVAAGLNDAFVGSCGNLVCFVASDDEPEPTLVAEMKTLFAEDPQLGAVYTVLTEIDEESRPLESRFELPRHVPHEHLFAEMFIHRNCLPSPGLTMRREILAAMWPLDEGLLQHSDSAMNLKITAAHRFAFAQTPLMRYRVNRRGRSTGASNRSQLTKTRESAEVSLLLDYADRLIGDDVSTFLRLFGHLELVKSASVVPETVSFWLARIALTSDQYDKRLWGLRRIMQLMSVRARADLLRSNAGFTFKDMLSLAQDVHSQNRFYHKFCKYRTWTFRLRFLLALITVLFITLLLWQAR